MLKKLTAEEKLALLQQFNIARSLTTDIVRGILDCPYGDPTHGDERALAAGGARLKCMSCSKLDGSECVDRFLELHDEAVSRCGSASIWSIRLNGVGGEIDLDTAVAYMRAWRASKGE